MASSTSELVVDLSNDCVKAIDKLEHLAMIVATARDVIMNHLERPMGDPFKLVEFTSTRLGASQEQLIEIKTKLEELQNAKRQKLTELVALTNQRISLGEFATSQLAIATSQVEAAANKLKGRDPTDISEREVDELKASWGALEARVASSDCIRHEASSVMRELNILEMQFAQDGREMVDSLQMVKVELRRLRNLKVVLEQCLRLVLISSRT